MIKKRELAECDSCPLADNPFVSNEINGSKICFVAEAPGKIEVEQGRPLVGPAGRILYQCIDDLGYKRGTFDYQNAVLCRAVESTNSGSIKNRNPNAKEIMSCNKRLLHETSQYDILITLGSTAYSALVGLKNVSVGTIAKNFTPCMALNNVPTLGTYHPASIIYNRNASDTIKRLMKQTIQTAVNFVVVKEV